MSEKKTGVIFRSYAKTPEEVTKVVSRAIKSVEIAGSINDGRPMFDEVVIMVASDKDCGQTARALHETLESEGLHAYVLQAAGSPNSDVLNAGLRLLNERGVDYAAIISHKAAGYMNHATIKHMTLSLKLGAKVAGLAVGELLDFVLKGRVQNTFAMWDIKALLGLDVPGFDAPGGVEEIAPSIRLIREFGSCIAAFLPVEEKGLNVRDTEDAMAEHARILSSKEERQQAEADRLGATLGDLSAGLMDG